MKRILTIQDISCIGKCSLTVALPIISAMGVETAILPTAVLSTHTMFKGFTFRDLTQDITPISNHWKTQNINFDAIYTGYLGSYEQIDLVEKIFSEFTTPTTETANKTLKFVDPCMADNGKLYSGFTNEFAVRMAKLAGKADIIVPNLTEASFLLDIPYKESGYDEKYIKDILLRLADLGTKKVVVKGVCLNENELGIMSYDSETKEFSSYFHQKLSTSFHGTGDIYASVCMGALMQGKTFNQALKLAADFVVRSIKATLTHSDHNSYGVDFETEMPWLLNQ
ncbi:MAG: phosphomethylpyrimidine kinase [Treponema sp. CETP13]|nr:MAG: phosphomethylpyrimidine kinase [Treponema sp. CETP13]